MLLKTVEKWLGFVKPDEKHTSVTDRSFRRSISCALVTRNLVM